MDSAATTKMFLGFFANCHTRTGELLWDAAAEARGSDLHSRSHRGGGGRD